MVTLHTGTNQTNNHVQVLIVPRTIPGARARIYPSSSERYKLRFEQNVCTLHRNVQVSVRVRLWLDLHLFGLYSLSDARGGVFVVNIQVLKGSKTG